METVGLLKEEKKLLIGYLVGFAIVTLLLLGWTIYLFSLMNYDLAVIKRVFVNNPETIAYTLVPLVVIIVWVLPQGSKLWKDISAGKVEEGRAAVVKVKRPWTSRDWFVELDAPGKEKIKIQRKDLYKLTPGKKIKFRITLSSKMLIGFEMLDAK